MSVRGSALSVVVVTAAGREEWAENCLESISASNGPEDVRVVTTPYFEVEGLRRALVAGEERFLLLQDSWEVESEAFWDHMPLTGSVWLFGRPVMYAGIYEADHLQPILDVVPTLTTKDQAIRYETLLCDRYSAAARVPHIWPNVTDHTALYQEWAFGRMNLVLGVPGVVIKRKGTWASGVTRAVRTDVTGVN